MGYIAWAGLKSFPVHPIYIVLIMELCNINSKSTAVATGDCFNRPTAVALWKPVNDGTTPTALLRLQLTICLKELFQHGSGQRPLGGGEPR